MRAFPYLTLAKLDRATSHQLTSYRVPADSKMEKKLCVGLNPVDYCKSSTFRYVEHLVERWCSHLSILGGYL